MVRDDVEAVIAELTALDEGHRADGGRHFYEVRDGRFNAHPARRARVAGTGAAYTPALAAMLIYLNRTGYNGLFRVNSRGAFNVPAGRYASVRICDAAEPAAALGARSTRPRLTLEVRELRGRARRTARRGDFVYLDPPYAPVSRTAQFTSYTAGRFGPEAAGRAAARGHRPGASRRRGAAQQFRRPGNPPALRRRRRRAIGRARGNDGRGPPRHQLAGVPAAAPCASTSSRTFV